MIPLLLSFPEINSDSLQLFESMITFFFLFDILLNFSTGFYQRGNLVLKRKFIVSHYLKSWFILGKLSKEFIYSELKNLEYLKKNTLKY